jgi:sarcosine oxidase subunit alpha
MRRTVRIQVNGEAHDVDAGCTLAAALLNLDVSDMRRSLGGESRSALCGMGVCFECRVTVNGDAHVRACMTRVAPGMDVRTGKGA